MRSVLPALLILLGGCAVERSVTCWIDGREVTRAEFDALFKTLKEAGGWYCAETNTGGCTGWNAENARGEKYRYADDTDGKRRTLTLERLP